MDNPERLLSCFFPFWGLILDYSIWVPVGEGKKIGVWATLSTTVVQLEINNTGLAEKAAGHFLEYPSLLSSFVCACFFL